MYNREVIVILLIRKKGWNEGNNSNVYRKIILKDGKT